LEHALNRELRDGAAVAVLFLDVDDLKATNDTQGHAAGDDVLRQVGARLVESLRGADTAARLAGDEFAILLEGLEDELRATDTAERVLAVLSAPLSVEGQEISIGVSIGVAFAESDGQGAAAAEDLLRNADVAMYMAKDCGKGRYQIFEPNMHAVAIERLQLKADLQQAVSNGEFTVHYQPIVTLRSGQISVVEALVRWLSPERGMVPPGHFIPLAEETGVINSIGRVVLEEACREGLVLQRSVVPTSALDQTIAIQPCMQGAKSAGKASTVLLSPGGSGSAASQESTPPNQLILPENSNVSRLIVPPCLVLSSSSGSGGGQSGGPNTVLPGARAKGAVTAPPCTVQMTSS